MKLHEFFLDAVDIRLPCRLSWCISELCWCNFLKQIDGTPWFGLDVLSELFMSLPPTYSSSSNEASSTSPGDIL